MDYEKYNDPNKRFSTMQKRAEDILHSIENDYYREEGITDAPVVRKYLEEHLETIADEKKKEHIQDLIEELAKWGY